MWQNGCRNRFVCPPVAVPVGCRGMDGMMLLTMWYIMVIKVYFHFGDNYIIDVIKKVGKSHKHDPL